MLGFHHVFIRAMADTFQWIPLGKATFDVNLAKAAIKDTQDIFAIAVRFASPVLISLLFTTAALSLLARVFPQLNIFTLSFPLSFFVGLSVYLASLPFFPDHLASYYEEYSIFLMSFLKTLRP